MFNGFKMKIQIWYMPVLLEKLLLKCHMLDDLKNNLVYCKQNC